MPTEFTPAQLERFTASDTIWLATVRPNATPHLSPIWFVWEQDRIYICTSRKSVKARNISTNQNVTLALEDGSNPIIAQGRARFVEKVPPTVIESFKEKYDWEIANNQQYDAVIEITPTKVMGW
jgi:putative heme iron utilization protein